MIAKYIAVNGENETALALTGETTAAMKQGLRVVGVIPNIQEGTTWGAWIIFGPWSDPADSESN